MYCIAISVLPLLERLTLQGAVRTVPSISGSQPLLGWLLRTDRARRVRGCPLPVHGAETFTN